MLNFFIIAGAPLVTVATYYLAYWFESGNRIRFSLRTLLIATTLVAVALGFAVHTARK